MTQAYISTHSGPRHYTEWAASRPGKEPSVPAEKKTARVAELV
jgi:hypothetical protein